jgi:hypothetical protein
MAKGVEINTEPSDNNGNFPNNFDATSYQIQSCFDPICEFEEESIAVMEDKHDN